ncbi:Gfo/Idh/MocA family protein [Pararhizobium mangrovi]|uniref:Gfo/Idh/MocA family oxidoreductase n=1 Tax=Pararhizobium mangrovi TaxID=2590452 RepID=A0A506UHR7_9HYPH|nr:Gfo/Idh/MocA family oxidoreductase [Pararhizobium mangrovi]TPW32850.1 Gfo/Idh/MocA family oxidoreductase [Pararhizobium mangrovi]
MTKELGIGIVGCGYISKTYFTLAPLFHGIRIVACADIDPAATKARAEEYGVAAQSVEALLGNGKVDIVVNLTVPSAHFEVTKAALDAGKHVYSEKPLVLSMEEGEALRRLADEKGLVVASTPDTFLGGAHQHARAVLDEGLIGRVVSGTCHVMSRGMEHWHPNPDFFFKPGAGPILDVGPYYVANLINLIGPVRRVGALTSMARTEREILCEPRKGEMVAVETPTTIHALLEFEQGATVTLSASWDVWTHGHAPMELYGTEGSLFVPDPNFFGGPVEAARQGAAIAPLEAWDHPLEIVNQEHPDGMKANYRTVGLAEMADAIVAGREPCCSIDRALHGVDIMTSILRSGEEKRFVELTTTCERPPAFGVSKARALLKD